MAAKSRESERGSYRWRHGSNGVKRNIGGMKHQTSSSSGVSSLRGNSWLAWRHGGWRQATAIIIPAWRNKSSGVSWQRQNVSSTDSVSGGIITSRIQTACSAAMGPPTPAPPPPPRSAKIWHRGIIISVARQSVTKSEIISVAYRQQ